MHCYTLRLYYLQRGLNNGLQMLIGVILWPKVRPKERGTQLLVTTPNRITYLMCCFHYSFLFQTQTVSTSPHPYTPPSLYPPTPFSLQPPAFSLFGNLRIGSVLRRNDSIIRRIRCHKKWQKGKLGEKRNCYGVQGRDYTPLPLPVFLSRFFTRS